MIKEENKKWNSPKRKLVSETIVSKNILVGCRNPEFRMASPAEQKIKIRLGYLHQVKVGAGHTTVATLIHHVKAYLIEFFIDLVAQKINR